MCIKANTDLPKDVSVRISEMKSLEPLEEARSILSVIEDNANIARREGVPMCQDTGMVVVFAEIGKHVEIEGPILESLINQGVRKGYSEGKLRASVVSDPLNRVNTKDNTPAVVHQRIVEGNQLKLSLMPKGFGSENMSQVFMLKPYEGKSGVIDAVLRTVKEAGPNPCPPIIVGVGIGGTFDQVAQLSKKALLRKIGEKHEHPFYDELESELLDAINHLGIGPQGFGGKTTALAVHIEYAPTHIAALPVAVNICCHASRHETIVL